MACNNGFSDCDSKVSNGCEINSANDSNNCGACGHECCGDGACSSGTCQAAVVPVQDASRVFDVDENFIYWSSANPGYTNGDLRKVSLNNPGTFETVFSNQDKGPTGVLVDQDNIFWTTYSGAYGWLNEDSTITYSSELASDPRVYANHLLWIAVLPGHVFGVCSKDLQGSTSAVCYPNSNWNASGGNLEFTSDGTHIYSASGGGGPIYKIEIQDGISDASATTYTTNEWELFADTHADGGAYLTMTTDGVNLYATYNNTTSSNTSNNGIWSFPLAGGSGTEIVSDTRVLYPSTDGVYIFYQSKDKSDIFRLNRVPVNGGPSVALAVFGSVTFDSTPQFNSKCVYVNTLSYNKGTGQYDIAISTVNKEP